MCVDDVVFVLTDTKTVTCKTVTVQKILIICLMIMICSEN